jgi:hypothetical protein
MICAIQQKPLEQSRIAGDAARAQAGNVRSLREARERDQVAEGFASSRRAAVSPPIGGDASSG